MSVRRLAAEQPESFAFSSTSEEKVKFWLNKYPHDRQASAVIPLLWIAQKQEGWVTEPAMREIAARCDMPYIRVYEVATFYTMFNLAPVAKNYIQVCGTTPCWLRGADELKAVCESKIARHGRYNLSEDGQLCWEEVECLGACANAPMAQISNADGDWYYEDLTPEALERILDDLSAGKSIESGPVSARNASEPTEAKVEVLTDQSLFDGSRAKPLKSLPNAANENASAPEPEATNKKASRAEQKTREKTGPSVAKPAPTEGVDAKKPSEARPKPPKKPDPGAGAQPELLDAPRDGKGDDLKKIGGIGPKLAGQLYESGIYHYDQIAAWGPAEIRWMDEKLKFKGRIEREDWVGQAKQLAGKA
mgnify:FL=1